MELVHEGLLDLSSEQLQRVLLLRNTSSQAALFKVQCTAPRKLRVRPALGFLAASASVSIQVHLNPQECTSAMCKLLLVGRQTEANSVEAVDAQQLKATWRAAEAQTETLVLSETINVRIQSGDSSGDKAMALCYTTPPQVSKLSTAQVAELVALLMKSQSSREENALETAERERLMAAKKLQPTEWPIWEEYAARMRKLLRERSKRTTRGNS